MASRPGRRRHVPLLPPFAEHPYGAVLEIDVIHVEPGELRDAHAGRRKASPGSPDLAGPPASS